MFHITLRGPIRRNGLTVGLFLSALSTCLAQTPAPANQRSLVRVSVVKPEMQIEWLALQKSEIVPALKKAGVASRTLLETLIGNVYEYYSITPFTSYSVLDGDSMLVKALGKEAGARLQAKINRCLESQSTFLSTRVDELSSLPKTPGVIWISTRFRVNAGKGNDFENFLKTDVLPFYARAKEAGKIAGYSLSRRGVGANSRDRTVLVYLNKGADMDLGNPLTQALGTEGAAKVNAKGAAFAASVETMTRRRVAELSY